MLKKSGCIFLYRQQNAGQYHNITTGNTSDECQIYANSRNKSFVFVKTLCVTLRECLLPFGPESFVLQFAVKKYEA